MTNSFRFVLISFNVVLLPFGELFGFSQRYKWFRWLVLYSMYSPLDTWYLNEYTRNDNKVKRIWELYPIGKTNEISDYKSIATIQIEHHEK